MQKVKRLTREQKIEKADKSKKEIWSMFIDYVKNNLINFSGNVSSSNNYVIRYWISSDKISSAVMASDNWQEQPRTANDCIEIFNNSSAVRWGYESDIVFENLAIIIEYNEDDYLKNEFEDWKDKITERAWKALKVDDKFLRKFYSNGVYVVLRGLQLAGELEREFEEYKESFIGG